MVKSAHDLSNRNGRLLLFSVCCLRVAERQTSFFCLPPRLLHAFIYYLPSRMTYLFATHTHTHTHTGVWLLDSFSSSSSSLSSLFFFPALCLFRQKYFSRSLSRCWGFEPVFLWVRQGADKNRKYRLADWRILIFLFLCCEGEKKKGWEGGRKLRTKQPKPSIICLFFCIKGTIQFGPEATTITTKKYYV